MGWQIRRSMVLLPSSVRLALTSALAVVMLVSSDVASAASSVWELAKIDGRDYVTAQSVQRFYGFTRMARDGTKVTLENAKVEMILRVGGQECLMNGVKFVFSNPVIEQSEKVYVSRTDLAKLIDPVLRPNYIRNAGDFRTVILDPGHGGADGGATGLVGQEAEYNLLVAKRTKTLLEQRGFRVLMTRDGSQTLTLQDRVNFANAVKESAVFISIHFNSGGKEARGIETFTLSPPGVAHYGRGVKASDFFEKTGNVYDSANMALATSIHGSVLMRLGKQTFDRGIKRARFDVLTGVQHPAVLLEGGFLTHPFESKLINSPVYQEALARGIVDAIAKYRFAVGGGREAAYR